MKKILYCENCKEYTLKEKCTKCNNQTIRKIPPKYSLQDKFASYRRQIKEKERKEKGLL